MAFDGMARDWYRRRPLIDKAETDGAVW